MSSQQIDQYWGALLDAGLIETERHHEFRDGLHGYKADFEAVAPPGSDLFNEGVGLLAEYVTDKQHYLSPPDTVIGVANGANQLALALAEELGSKVSGLQTVKNRDDPSMLEFPFFSERRLGFSSSRFALVIDDIGTSGSSTAQVAQLCKGLDVPRVEALYLLQRSTSLQNLGRIGVSYQALIKYPMDNLTPDECYEVGPCSVGVELVEHPNRRHPVS